MGELREGEAAMFFLTSSKGVDRDRDGGWGRGHTV